MIRKLRDGSIAMIRYDAELIKKLNETMIQVPDKLRWFPKDKGQDVELLRNSFAGKVGYVIGKGPSIDNLDFCDFPYDGPVICINESIHCIEKLKLKNKTFVVQQDAGLRESCRPTNSSILLPYELRHLYSDILDRFIYVPSTFQLKDNSLSALCAVECLKLMGVTKVVLYGFDSICGVTGYAKSIGHAPEGNPERFLAHKNVISNQMGKMPHEWKLVKSKIKSKLSICAIVKNEVDYIEEWIDFHRLQGVEHFYIYLNNSTDGTAWKLRPYVEAGVVTTINWPMYPGQHQAYTNCLQTFKDQSEWIAVIDVDEFLFCPDGAQLPERLKEYSEFPAVAVHWIMYGSNGHQEKEFGFVTKRFTARDPVVNDHVKTIVNTKFPCSYKHSHIPSGVKIVDENKNEITGPVVKEGTANKLRINHYFTKSLKEFEVKIARGRSDILTQRKIEEFEMYNRNQEQDPILFYTPIPFDPDITLITCTGDRHEAFVLCEKWMEKQNYTGKIEWIVVDDGVVPTICTMGQHVIRRFRKEGEPQHTLILNLREAMKDVTADRLFFIEDDDYYAPDYLTTMLEHPNAVVGLQRARYYNVAKRMYRNLKNTNHASLCNTSIRRDVYEKFISLLDDENPCIDLRLYEQPLDIKLFESPISVGIKCMPGRKGLLSGHTNMDGFLDDQDLTVLKDWLGKDFNEYQDYGIVD